MSPDLQQKLTERLVAILEDDLAQGEDFSTLKNDKVLLSYFQEFDVAGNNFWFPELKGQEIPNRFGREAITTEAFRIFYERHPEAAAKKTPARERNKQKAKYNRPRSSARSKEEWRFIDEYPNYQVSSHCRVRPVQRANADDFLKPRIGFKKAKGKGPAQMIISYTLRNRQGVRKDPSLQTLMTQAGFIDSFDAWKKRKQEKLELVAAGE
jgi:hypothetical protein